MSVHRNFIAGKWSTSVEAADNVNPSNAADTVGVYARGSRQGAEDAIAVAKQAFKTWSRSGIQLRDGILQVLVEPRETLVELLVERRSAPISAAVTGRNDVWGSAEAGRAAA